MEVIHAYAYIRAHMYICIQNKCNSMYLHTFSIDSLIDVGRHPPISQRDEYTSIKK